MLTTLKTNQKVAFAVAILVIAVWGETFVSSKVLLNAGLLPANIFVLRFTMAYAFMWALSHKSFCAKSWRHEMMFLALGLAGGSLYFLSENMALMYSTASNVAILVGTTPLMTALLMWIFYKDERMSRKQLTGSLVAFVGMVLVVLNGQLVLHLNPLGDMLALGAALTWGFYSLIMKRLSTQYDTRFITRKVFGYGLFTIIPYIVFVSPMNLDVTILSKPEVWGNLLYLGIIASMLCFVLWNWVLRRLGIIRTTNLIYSQSFFTMLISAIVLGERITVMAVVGTIVLICGMVFAARK